MNFLQQQLQGLVSFLGGTDRFTRTPIMNNTWFHNIYSRTYTEQYTTINNEEYNLYKSTPELSIVIDRKAQMFSNGVFVVKDYKTGEVIENHPIIKMLENPNGTQDRNLFLKTVCVNMDLYGNNYIFKNQGSMLSEYPSNLVILPSARTIIDRQGKKYRNVDLNDIIRYYIVRENGTDEKFTVDEIIHLKTVNSDDDIMGLSPLHALQMPISNIRGSYGFRNVNINERGALGIISPKQDSVGGLSLAEEDKIEISKQFTEKYGIFNGQARTKFSNKSIEYTPLAFPLKESMLFEEVDEDFKRIIDKLGLNENMFSRKNSSKFSNLMEAEKMAYQDTIIPFAENFCYNLNTGMNLFEKGFYIELDYSHLAVLSTDEKQRAETNKLKTEAYINLIQNGFSPDEARTITGL
jgi:HK97 family phage portal protein